MFCIYVDVWILKESLSVYAVQVWGKSMSNIKMKMDFCMWHTAVKPHSADRQQMITFMFTSTGFGHLQLSDKDTYGCVYIVYYSRSGIY